MAKPADPAAPKFDPNAATPQQTASSATADNPFNMSLDSLVNNGQKTTHRQGAETDSIAFHLQSPVLSVDRQTSAMDMIKGLYTMPADQLKQLQAQMQAANYIPKGYVSGLADQATIKGYEQLLGDVFAYQQNPDTKDMTIQQLLDMKAKGYAAGGGGSTKKTSTTNQVNLFSPLEAQGFLEGAMEKYLGRRPNAAEISGFSSALTSFQSSNPSSSTTTTNETVDGAGNVTDNNNSTQQDGGASGAGDTAAENFVLSGNPVEAKGYAGDNALMAIMSHLGLPQ